MTLKQDERALLQLICERGQTYEDLALLLGIEVEAVRERTRGALTTLAGTDPDAEVGLTDYLLGQADQIGRADAARFLQRDPATHEIAVDLVAKLAALFPGATLPKLPALRAPRGAAAKRPAGPTSSSTAAGNARSPVQQRRLIGLIAVVGVVLTVAIFAIAGVFSGDDEAQQAVSQAAAEDQTASDQATPPEEAPLTEAAIEPVGGSGVGGSAEIGLTDQVLYVDVQVDGLPPQKGDAIYLVWLMASDEAGFPLPTPLVPDDNGSVGGRIAVPAPATQLVAPITTAIAVSRSDRTDLNEEIKAARDAESPLLPFVGEMLAIGELPAAPASG